jgi:hypothetical protein
MVVPLPVAGQAAGSCRSHPDEPTSKSLTGPAVPFQLTIGKARHLLPAQAVSVDGRT